MEYYLMPHRRNLFGSKSHNTGQC